VTAVAAVTGFDWLGRRRHSLAQHLAARALVLALDPAVPPAAAADALIRLARGNAAPLDGALRLVRARAEPAGRLAAGADERLRLALDRVVAASPPSSPAPRRIDSTGQYSTPEPVESGHASGPEVARIHSWSAP